MCLHRAGSAQSKESKVFVELFVEQSFAGDLLSERELSLARWTPIWNRWRLAGWLMICMRAWPTD